MSVQMDASPEIDYSDFEYQHVHYNHNVQAQDSANSGPSSRGGVSIEPLQDAAGLDNNEVAELVAIRMSAYMEYEDAEQDQNVASMVEFRGHVGINLPLSESAFVDRSSAGGTEDEGTVFSNDADGDVANINEVGVETRTDDRVLLNYGFVGGVPFDDEAGGGGGNASSNHIQDSIMYRDMTGRGPVLDANDDITLISALNLEDIIIPVIGNVRLTLVWDVSETSDAGRAFSVPSDD